MLAAVMALQATGCSDPGPTAVPTPAHPNVVTLDLDAGRFQLDIGAQELRHPDGRVVDLAVDETEWLATEFAAQVSLANLATFTATAYTEADDECDWHTEYCEDAMLRRLGASTVQAGVVSVAPSYLQAAGPSPADANRGEQGDFERTYGRIKIRISNRRPSTSLQSPDPVVLEFQQGTTCADVRAAMLAARAEAEARRASLNALIEKVFGWLSFSLESGVPHATLGAGARGAVEDAVAGMETNRVNIALLILQGLYVQMGCSNVIGGSLPDENLPAGWEKQCKEVWGTIILPGNQVYTGWYRQCEIVRAM